MPLAHELSGCKLHGRPGGRCETGCDFRKTGGERRRRDEKAEPEGRADGLAEGADVNDASTAVEGGERRCGAAVELQLAEIVVLDHPGLRPGRPVEKTQSACQR